MRQRSTVITAESNELREIGIATDNIAIIEISYIDFIILFFI